MQLSSLLSVCCCCCISTTAGAIELRVAGREERGEECEDDSSVDRQDALATSGVDDKWPGGALALCDGGAAAEADASRGRGTVVAA